MRQLGLVSHAVCLLPHATGGSRPVATALLNRKIRLARRPQPNLLNTLYQ